MSEVKLTEDQKEIIKQVHFRQLVPLVNVCGHCNGRGMVSLFVIDSRMPIVSFVCGACHGQKVRLYKQEWEELEKIRPYIPESI